MKNNSKEVVLEFNLPEFKKKDIDVKLSKNSVFVRAEKKSEKKLQKKDFFHQEKTAKVFNYQTTLPKVNVKKAKIDFKLGVLKIVIPKA